MKWMVWRVLFCILLIYALVASTTAAMDRMRDNFLYESLSRYSPAQIRGVLQASGTQRQSTEADKIQTALNRDNIEALRQRMEKIDSQKVDVRMAVIEAKLDALFELTRILIVGAALSIIQMLGKIIAWFSGRGKSDTRLVKYDGD